MKELVLFLSDMKDRNVGICSVRQGFDTSTSVGEIMFQFVGILSSWEREMIRKRTLAGLERAKSEGKTLGRRKVTDDTMTAKILELRNGKKSIREIASEVGVSRGTVNNILKVVSCPLISVPRISRYSTSMWRYWDGKEAIFR